MPDDLLGQSHTGYVEPPDPNDGINKFKKLDAERRNIDGVEVYRQKVTDVIAGAGTRTTRKLLDWYDPGGGSVLPRYKGFGPQSAAATDPLFTVYRQTWSLQSDGTYKITDEQVLTNVAWGANRAARDALGWS